jgi:hypothetical protein
MQTDTMSFNPSQNPIASVQNKKQLDRKTRRNKKVENACEAGGNII